MAFWGVDIMQNDGFCKIYDEYMDMYDAGGEACDVSAHILEKYKFLNRYEMHNLYFAVAKAEHTICAQTVAVLEKVREIIESGADVEYYRSLGFSTDELLKRKEKLLAFLKALQKPRQSARKRKISSYNSIKRLPKGALGFYEAESEFGFYGFVVLDAVYEGRLLAITERLSKKPETAEEVLKAPALTVIWLLLRTVPKGYTVIDNINIEENFNGRGGMFICKPISFGLNFAFDLEECHKRKCFEFSGEKIYGLLRAEKIPIEFLCEETREEEIRIVVELEKNPASRFAMEKIKAAINFGK